jgi:hypothetical protein
MSDLTRPKPPFHFDRYINGILMAEDVCVEREADLASATAAAARIASRGPNGEVPVLVYRAPAVTVQDELKPCPFCGGDETLITQEETAWWSGPKGAEQNGTGA